MGILKAQALEIIRTSKERNQPFSIDFVTMDKSRKTAGHLKQMTGMISTGSNHNTKEHGTITIKRKNQTGHPVTVHINLILKVNQEQVL